MNSIKGSFEQITSLIDNNKIEDAIKILTSIQDGSAWMQNAMAVCLMRQGKPEKAVSILIDSVYKKNSVIIRSDAAEMTKLNLSTAMMLAGNVDGAITVLHEVRQDMPMKEQLDKAIRNWKKQLSVVSRLLMVIGIYPNDKPVKLDFPPGQIQEQ